MSYEPKAESKTFWNNRLFTFVAALLTILLFLFVILFVYIPLRPQPIDTEVIAARKKTLSEVQSFQQKVATSYMWSDKEKGLVVIPVAQAMELTVKEYSAPAMEAKWLKAREEAIAAFKSKQETLKNIKPAAANAVKATQPAEAKPQNPAGQGTQKSEDKKVSLSMQLMPSFAKETFFDGTPPPDPEFKKVSFDFSSFIPAAETTFNV
jgi:hypothetical protein